MKRFTKKSIALYVTFAILIVFLTGAQCTIGGCSVTFNDYTGKAVNIKAADSTEYWKDASGDTLDGVEVSLYAYDPVGGSYETDAYATAEVVDGSFTFYSPESNRYKLTATSPDWVFIPQYIEVTNNGASAKDLYAFPADTAGEWTIIASWETTSIDLDLSLTYGSDSAATTRSWLSGDTFAPTSPAERLHIHHSARGSKSTVYHDMDITENDDDALPRVETISLYSAAWFADEDTIKVYIDSTNTSTAGATLTGEEGDNPSAYAQVDLMYYNNVTKTSIHYGTWYAPWNTAETTLQILDIRYDLDTHTYTMNTPNSVSSIKSIIWEN